MCDSAETGPSETLSVKDCANRNGIHLSLYAFQDVKANPLVSGCSHTLCVQERRVQEKVDKVVGHRRAQ